MDGPDLCKAFMVELSSLLIITEAADVPKDFKRVFVGPFGGNAALTGTRERVGISNYLGVT